MKKLIISFFVIVSFSGCAAQLTQQGSMVRQIQPDWATNCKFLGVIEASEGAGLDYSDDMSGALNTVRNKVAERGGNAFVINQTASSVMRTKIQADAYNCPR